MKEWQKNFTNSRKIMDSHIEKVIEPQTDMTINVCVCAYMCVCVSVINWQKCMTKRFSLNWRKVASHTERKYLKTNDTFFLKTLKRKRLMYSMS